MPKMIAVIIELVVAVGIMWLLVFLSTLLHELGHAIGYMLSTGGNLWHIRIGSGKKLLEIKYLTVKLLLLDGKFNPSGNRIDSKKKFVSTLVGGPAISLVLVIVLLILRGGRVSFHSEMLAPSAIESFISFALFSNAFILISSILPGHCLFGEIIGMETDGMKILHAIKDKEKL